MSTQLSTSLPTHPLAGEDVFQSALSQSRQSPTPVILSPNALDHCFRLPPIPTPGSQQMFLCPKDINVRCRYIFIVCYEHVSDLKLE